MEQIALPSPSSPESPVSFPQKDSPYLSVKNLSHQYNHELVLDHISFEIRKGELLGFLGPNGAGKTTCFQVICGLIGLQKGEMLFQEKPCHPQNPEYRKSFGVVFQQPSLDLKLSALENLILSASLYKIPKRETLKRAMDLLRFMDLDSRARDPVEFFSGGMRRRLEIIRALIHGPEFLILDEPTSGLDESGFQKIWEKLKNLSQKSNLTMLLTTHRPEEANLCDRLILLDKGRIVAKDAPQKLIEKIGGDILVLDPWNQPEEEIIKKLKTILKQKIRSEPKLIGTPSCHQKILLEMEKAHEAIPKIIENFSKNTFRSINIHRPNLADVFVQLTGRTLDEEKKDTDHVDL